MSLAYYNENDRYAAAWLRELIKGGHIADGIVDERSIEDVQPSDLAGYSQCHFFAGIGGWSYALRLAGWPESGIFPLAHGIPGRVGLLRGYGNAIVPQVAAEFIQASVESIES